MQRRVLNVNIFVNIAINGALALPPVEFAFRAWRLRQGHNAEKDLVRYPMGVFRKHAAILQTYRQQGITDAQVLEIGPGGNVGSSLLMLLAGAQRVTCIDRMPWVRGTQLDHLYTAIIAQAAQDPATYLVAPQFLEQARSDPKGLAESLLDRIVYRAPESINTTTLPDSTFDFIFSNACFEHFADPGTAIAQIARLIRPGGVTSHQIDLRDHRDFGRPLGHLRYSERMWWLANVRLPNGVRNRWRASEYYASFEQNGLELVQRSATQSTVVTEEQRQRFNKHFRDMTLEDLSVIDILVVAIKR
jgi:SAM-dependent methyltransferase